MLHFFFLLRFNWSYYSFVQWNCWVVKFTNTPFQNEPAYCAVLSRPNAWWTKIQTSDWNSLSSKTDASISQSHHHQHKGPPWAHWCVRLKRTKLHKCSMFTHGEQSPNLGHKCSMFTHGGQTPNLGHKCSVFTHGETNAQPRAQVLNVHARWTNAQPRAQVFMFTHGEQTPNLGHKCQLFMYLEQSPLRARVVIIHH